MGRSVGYMRVSTREQKFDLQHDALTRAGVPEGYIYQDVASGAKQARPGLAACLKALQPGNTLVVWKLDRVARSLLHLLEIPPGPPRAPGRFAHSGRRGSADEPGHQ
jgi:DNA invertase Pin-like site-specific DNA recombinase